MCGICGKYSPFGVSIDELDPMLHALSHRGPDDEGTYFSGPVGIGNRRLSIIDLPGGKQPLSNEDGSVWIVYNGEIYNYLDLRSDLQRKGHVFRTHTDTEVIVHLYEEYGDKCVKYLSGMFAFAIWDEDQEKLLLARDRIGQKPLYYAYTGDDFIFASEPKAILAVSSQPRELDYLSLHYYLTLRFIPSPRTIFSNISKLPPAHILVYQHGETSIFPYWELSFNNKLALSEKEFLDGLNENLIQTINSHLIGDVPIGAYLSGGLDSSMLVAILSRDLEQHLQTFAIGVEAEDFNELPYARLVADHCQTDHVEACVASDLFTLLPKMIWHLDEPSDPIAACMFYAAELASRSVKVVLGGDGGDELFAGFDRYLGSNYIDLYSRWLPRFFRQYFLGPIFETMPDNFKYKSLTQKMRWVHQLSLVPEAGARYAEATSFFRFGHTEKQNLFSQDLWDLVGYKNASHVIIEPFNKADSDNLVDKMLYADFTTRLPEHSLMLTDRMTMAHSLESRSPYLDHQLVEYLAAFPSHLKIRNKTTKYIFRELARQYLPAEIVRRDKQGFMFPIAYWFKNEYYPFLSHILQNSFFVKNGIFNRNAIQRLLDQHRTNQRDNHVRLWMLLNIEIWHRIFLRGEDFRDVSVWIAEKSAKFRKISA